MLFVSYMQQHRPKYNNFNTKQRGFQMETIPLRVTNFINPCFTYVTLRNEKKKKIDTTRAKYIKKNRILWIFSVYHRKRPKTEQYGMMQKGITLTSDLFSMLFILIVCTDIIAQEGLYRPLCNIVHITLRSGWGTAKKIDFAKYLSCDLCGPFVIGLYLHVTFDSI